MVSRYRLLILLLLVLSLMTIAGDRPPELLPKRYISPAEYNQNENQLYRDAMQLRFKILEDRIKVLEGE